MLSQQTLSKKFSSLEKSYRKSSTFPLTLYQTTKFWTGPKASADDKYDSKTEICFGKGRQHV